MNELTIQQVRDISKNFIKYKFNYYIDKKYVNADLNIYCAKVNFFTATNRQEYKYLKATPKTNRHYLNSLHSAIEMTNDIHLTELQKSLNIFNPDEIIKDIKKLLKLSFEDAINHIDILNKKILFDQIKSTIPEEIIKPKKNKI